MRTELGRRESLGRHGPLPFRVNVRLKAPELGSASIAISTNHRHILHVTAMAEYCQAYLRHRRITFKVPYLSWPGWTVSVTTSESTLPTPLDQFVERYEWQAESGKCCRFVIDSHLDYSKVRIQIKSPVCPESITNSARFPPKVITFKIRILPSYLFSARLLINNVSSKDFQSSSL
jgi:hypothetical protein